MTTIYFLNNKIKNVGDIYSSPIYYFNFENYQTHDLGDKINLKNQHVVIGGGGLIRRTFEIKIKNIVSQKPKSLIFWGIGHNASYKDKDWQPEFLQNADLVGIRDYNTPNTYVPCASCMHKGFDKNYHVKHEHVYFLHKHRTPDNINLDGPIMYNNNLDIDEVLSFIGSTKILITNSFHGAYWGMLMNKDVRILDWSTKFSTLKHVPSRVNNLLDWKQSVPSNIDKNYLKECRDINIRFYDSYKNLLRQSS